MNTQVDNFRALVTQLLKLSTTTIEVSEEDNDNDEEVDLESVEDDAVDNMVTETEDLMSDDEEYDIEELASIVNVDAEPDKKKKQE